MHDGSARRDAPSGRRLPKAALTERIQSSHPKKTAAIEERPIAEPPSGTGPIHR